MFSTPISALLIKESSREILGTLVFWASLSFVSYSTVWAKSTANCFPNKIFNIEVLQASPCCTHLSGAYYTSGFLRLRVPLHAFCTHRLWLPNHHFTVASVKKAHLNRKFPLCLRFHFYFYQESVNGFPNYLLTLARYAMNTKETDCELKVETVLCNWAWLNKCKWVKL